MSSVRDLLRVGPTVDLSAIDPRSTPGLPGRKVTGRDVKGWARDRLAPIGAELAEQQEMLYAAAKASGDRRRLLLLETLGEMDLSYPKADFDLDAERRRLEADREPAMAGS